MVYVWKGTKVEFIPDVKDEKNYTLKIDGMKKQTIFSVP